MKNLCVKLGSYKNRNWEEKNNWEQIWLILEDKNGNEYIKFNPIMINFLKAIFWNDFEWFVSIFENSKEKKSKDEEVPF